MDTKIDPKKNILTIKTKYNQEYNFGAGTNKGKRKLLIYNALEEKQIPVHKGIKIAKSLTNNGFYIIKNNIQTKNIRQESILYTRVILTEDEIFRIREIIEYLNGRLVPECK